MESLCGDRKQNIYFKDQKVNRLNWAELFINILSIWIFLGLSPFFCVCVCVFVKISKQKQQNRFVIHEKAVQF